MKKRIIIFMILFSAVFPKFVFSEELDTKKALEDINLKLSDINSYSADMSFYFVFDAEEKKIDGKISFDKPDYLWMEISSSDARQPSQLMISNGENYWMYIPRDKVVFVTDLKIVREKYPDYYLEHQSAGISSPFRGMDISTITLISEKDYNNGSAYVFRARPGSDFVSQGVDFSEAEFWIGIDDGLLKKIVFFDKDNNPVMTQVYSNIKVNIPVDKERFDFKIPEEVEVIDMTENMLKAAGGV